jgi:hypothetical protein
VQRAGERRQEALEARFGETVADRHRFLSWRQSILRAGCGRQLNGQSVQRRGEIRQLLGVGVGQTAANGHCPLGGLEPTASQVTFLQSAPPMQCAANQSRRADLMREPHRGGDHEHEAPARFGSTLATPASSALPTDRLTARRATRARSARFTVMHYADLPCRPVSTRGCVLDGRRRAEVTRSRPQHSPSRPPRHHQPSDLLEPAPVRIDLSSPAARRTASPTDGRAVAAVRPPRADQAPTPRRPPLRVALVGARSRLGFAQEVPVLHFPGVVQDVEGAVADEERQRP